MGTYRILIVDDEEDTLELYEKFLQFPDCDIVTESSSRNALELLRKECWDLLISDIYMPDIDGFEVMKAGMESNPDLRCIAVTGYGTEKVLENVLEQDCFGYINKPFDWQYLKLLINKAMKPASTRRRPPGHGKQDN